MSRQISQLEDQKEFYLEKKEKIKAEREELVSNPQLLEKFARERYLMKKPTEDIYVIVEK
jgi:cell division protein FtsB